MAMVELSPERIEEILHKETVKEEDPKTVMRAVYNRYRCVFEQYIDQIFEMNQSKIDEFNKYHQETNSLIKYYFVDIPMDTCAALAKFEHDVMDYMLGPDWQRVILNGFEEFKRKNKNKYRLANEETWRKKFKEELLSMFYVSMESAFRVSFESGSKAAEGLMDGLSAIFGLGGD